MKQTTNKKTNTETLLENAIESKAMRLEYKDKIDTIQGVFGGLLRKQFDGETTQNQDVLVNVMAENYRYSEDIKGAKNEVFKKLPKPEKPQYNYPGGMPPVEVRKGLDDGTASDEEKKKAQEDYNLFMTYARDITQYRKGLILQQRIQLNHQDVERRKKRNRKGNKLSRKSRATNRK